MKEFKHDSTTESKSDQNEMDKETLATHTSTKVVEASHLGDQMK